MDRLPVALLDLVADAAGASLQADVVEYEGGVAVFTQRHHSRRDRGFLRFGLQTSSFQQLPTD